VSASTNIADFINALGEKKEAAQHAAVRALDQFGEHVLGDAQQLAPVDTGFLKASGTSKPAEESGGKVTKVIGFNASYALAVHERLDLHHDQGQAKYLETAVRNNASKLEPFVIDEVKKVL
jgi:hypothetical protein